MQGEYEINELKTNSLLCIFFLQFVKPIYKKIKYDKHEPSTITELGSRIWTDIFLNHNHPFKIKKKFDTMYPSFIKMCLVCKTNSNFINLTLRYTTNLPIVTPCKFYSLNLFF